jgi:hypothetical protein
MDDPLSRALHEAPPKVDEHRDAVSHHHAAHARAFGAVLDDLRAQLVDAMKIPFFDAGLRVEMVPITKHVSAETGAASVIARKHEPAYEASASVEVRCDHPEPGDRRAAADAGAYTVRARASLRCDDDRGRSERAFVLEVHEVDARLLLDADRLRSDLAEAIRSIGTSA